VASLARTWWIWVSAAAVVCAGVIAVVLWWPTRHDPPPRARQYLDFDACLLTGDGGVVGGAASTVWAGMQDASAATGVRVSFLPVPGEQTAATATPYLGSLIARRCGVILAVGEGPVAAVGTEAAKYRASRFVAVGGAARCRPMWPQSPVLTSGRRCGKRSWPRYRASELRGWPGSESSVVLRPAVPHTDVA
jgi:hypothetical protein